LQSTPTSTAVYQIPSPDDPVKSTDFDPVENEYLGIKSFFTLVEKYFIDTVGVPHLKHAERLWLFNSLLCNLDDHLGRRSYVQLALDGTPVSVFVVKNALKDEKINTNEPLEIWFQTNESNDDEQEHVIPLEIQTVATRYHRIIVSERYKYSNFQRTNPHNIPTKSLEYQIANLQRYTKHHIERLQIDSRHSIWYNIKELVSSFMFRHGIENLMYALMGQIYGSGYRVVWYFETGDQLTKSVSFMINDRKEKSEAVLLNLIQPLTDTMTSNTNGHETLNPGIPGRQVLSRCGINVLTHIISLFAGNIVPSPEYAQHFQSFDLKQSTRLNAEKFSLKFHVTCDDEKIGQILNIADKTPITIQRQGRIPKNNIRERGMNSFRLEHLETILSKFGVRTESLTRDQILAFQDGFISRSHHVRYFVRRILTMIPVTGGPQYKGTGFWTGIEDVKIGEDTNKLVYEKRKIGDRIRRSVLSVKSAEVKEMLAGYKLLLNWNHIQVKATNRYNKIDKNQKTEICDIELM